MKTMWAPWRMEYVLADKEDCCIFCEALEVQNNLTLFAGEASMVMMNKFPYINGHLLVAPVRHVAALDQLTKKEMGEHVRHLPQVAIHLSDQPTRLCLLDKDDLAFCLVQRAPSTSCNVTEVSDQKWPATASFKICNNHQMHWQINALG